ncbi:mechanosensitive ion channel family protein, partial [Acidisphaera sp. L21]|uniref:mechanosensitive ion channel family protein n=1 Tax=Acidisphaera sp. L21 TaxID=1641851 RepID=UPI00131A63C2
MEMTMTREAALTAASVLLLATIVVPRLISQWSLWARALWRVAALIVLTVLVQRVLGSPIAPRFQADETGVRLWEQVIEVGWWIIGAQSAIGLTRLFVVFETRPRETRIISDLLAGVIYLVTLLAIVNFVFDVPVGGLLATSGVIAIVLGLALQSSLADVFSGIAVGIERPYNPGDLLWVEGGIEGRVIQVNWRSTHIATFKGDVAVIPNSVIAKARLINHSLPTTLRGLSVTVKLDARDSPIRCMDTLTAAARACMLLEDDPAPSVARTELSGDGAVYEISFSVFSGAVILAARTELLGQVQNHLRHSGISLAVVGRPMVPRTEIPSSAQMLQESDWFGVLAAEDRSLLAAHLTEVLVRVGESLIRKGDDPQALFIIASGTVEISNGASGDKHVVFRMGPGGSLGAVGLITGSPYAATATALTPVKAYRLDKKAIGAAMQIRPELERARLDRNQEIAC